MIGFRFALRPSRSSSQLMTVFTLSLRNRLLQRFGEHLDPLAIANPYRVADQWARRRSTGDAAIGVVDATVTRAQEELRAGAPVHRAAQMRAIEPERGEVPFTGAS